MGSLIKMAVSSHVSREMNLGLPPEYLLLDLEVSLGGEIHNIGIIRGEESVNYQSGSKVHLNALAEFGNGAKAVVGHNIASHDLEILRARDPENKLLQLPVIDTLLLSPLCFPENPYHRLIKDYKLVKDSLNNPVADAKLAGVLFQEEFTELETIKKDNPTLASIYAACMTQKDAHPNTAKGFELLFSLLDVQPLDKVSWAQSVRSLLAGKVCEESCNEIFSDKQNPKQVHAFLVAWLLIAGFNSIIPRWVQGQFPVILDLAEKLRDRPCKSQTCDYCQVTHNTKYQLKKYFAFDDFRETPASKSGGSLQEEIVKYGMYNKPHLAILPTGGGKSMCFQLPALLRHFRTGSLTIVLSPLQALIKDQVENLRRQTGMRFAIDAIYGLQTMPERGAVYKKLILGDIALLYASPEQLRNKRFREAISQRNIGCWVFDEAHCLSKWGHDFRPDYLYAGRFIRELSASQGCSKIPPVACFSATAKEDVKRELLDYFENELSQKLEVFDGGTERSNLTYDVQIVTQHEKTSAIISLINDKIPNMEDGAAVVFCATQKRAEQVAAVLKDNGISAEGFHAGLDSEKKTEILDTYISGSIQVICATNAFGMGVDKADIRLVIHHDIPGSIENYVQEAGRAGRDQKEAKCVLLYNPGNEGKSGDIDTQFTLDAFGRISQSDIRKILQSIRISQKRQKAVDTNENPHVFLSASQILDEISTTFSEEIAASRRTKVSTAITSLETTGYLERNENQNRVFQGTARIATQREAENIIAKQNLSEINQKAWSAVFTEFLNLPRGHSPDIDTFARIPELNPLVNKAVKGRDAYSVVFRVLNEMAKVGLIKKDISYTAIIRYGVSNSSQVTFQKLQSLEKKLLVLLEDESPDAAQGEKQRFDIKRAVGFLHEEGFDWCLTEHVARIIGAIRLDGTSISEGNGSFVTREFGQGHYEIQLQNTWEHICNLSDSRINVATEVLNCIIKKIPSGTGRSANLSVNFDESDLVERIENDLVLSKIDDVQAAILSSLRYLHENGVIQIKGGLALLFQSMRIDLKKEAATRRYSKSDFEPLAVHYEEKNLQIHVMAEYAMLGERDLTLALALIYDYFALEKTEFIKKYFKGRESQIKRATSIDSYRRIVEELNNSDQARIVSEDVSKNMLILAGPGSGKTRTVAHRCAYLLRVERLKASQLLVLCYNRSAAITLRKRIHQLVGNDSSGITICTFHSLALKLLGLSAVDMFTKGNNSNSPENQKKFQVLIERATALLDGSFEIPGMDNDQVLQTLMGSWCHILIDEYQDIDQVQYDFVSAIAGRLRNNPDTKLAILAVGDDDQNIYQFRKTNTKFIRQFEDDYEAERYHLVENYRSTANIISAGNHLIQGNRDRMKIEFPIRINKARKGNPSGGSWGVLDPISQGQVHILSAKSIDHQPATVLEELKRIKKLAGQNFVMTDVAIVGRTRAQLNPVRAVLEEAGAQINWVSGDQNFPLVREREIQKGLNRLNEIINKHDGFAELNACQLKDLFPKEEKTNQEPWRSLFNDLIDEWCFEIGEASAPVEDCVHFLYDALSQLKSESRQKAGIYMGTAHSAKGLEFKHVIILDGGWGPVSGKTYDAESERRLFYVAMTRAMENLVIINISKLNNSFVNSIEDSDGVLRREPFANLSIDKKIQLLKYETIGMQDMFLDLCASDTQVRNSVSKVSVNERVYFKQENGRIYVKNEAGKRLGMFSKSANNEWSSKLQNIQMAKVLAIVSRKKSDQSPEYQSRSKHETWEVPLIEVCILRN